MKRNDKLKNIENAKSEKAVGLKHWLYCFLLHKKKPYNEYTVAYKHGLLPYDMGEIIYECEKCNLRFIKGFTYIKRVRHNWQFSINEGGDVKLFNIHISFKYWVIPDGFYLYIPTKYRLSWFDHKFNIQAIYYVIMR